MDRYQRQILLSEVGEKGQIKIQESKVLIIGAGGLGSAAALYLAASGVGHIGIADPDVVEQSNLNRQILHSPERTGAMKVESASLALNQFNPDITVRSYAVKPQTPEAFSSLLPGYDVILDCSDNYETRYALNKACISQKKTWIYAAVSEFEGQVMVIIPGMGPCYQCLYPSAPAPPKGPAAVMGVTPGLAGILQAAEALKIILDIGRPLCGRLLFLDLLDMRFEVLSTAPKKGCPVCGSLGTFLKSGPDV